MKKALFIRLDRMGDLVFSLPCDRLVRNTHEVFWFVPENLTFICQSARPQRVFTGFFTNWSFKNFKKFFVAIKKIKPEIAISFHAPWWVHLALCLAGVKTRGGVLSQWHSWVFLNRTLRQKRSQCELHEMEYNFQLTEFVFGLKKNRNQWQPLELKSSDSLAPVFHRLSTVDTKFSTAKLHGECGPDIPFNLSRDYFVVHPGMGGSALNWGSFHYTELIKCLAKKATVVITGTAIDRFYLKPIKKSLKENPGIVWLDEKLNPTELLKILKNSRANIAPSTGVLHLSASLGAVSIGLYSPVKVHSARRWGPKGKQVTVLSPQVDCPAHFKCLGDKCPHYFCMETISVDQVVKSVLARTSHKLS